MLGAALQHPFADAVAWPLEAVLAHVPANAALLCVLVACLQPLLPHLYRVTLLIGTAKLPFRIADPRSSYAAAAAAALPKELSRTISRAAGAHENGLEAIAPFGISVLAAMQAGVAPALIDRAAIIFITMRTIYYSLYVFGSSSAAGFTRFLVWSLSSGLLLPALLYAAAVKAGRSHSSNF